MRAVVVPLALAVLLRFCSHVSGGELFDTSIWKDNPPTAAGSVPFSDAVSLGGDDIGATIAYVDLFGKADKLSIYTAVGEQTDLRNALSPPNRPTSWLLQVATSAIGQAIEGGWTRFNFRDLKLVVTSLGNPGPNFLDGRGPFFRIEDGAFSAVDGFDQNPLLGHAEYFEPPDIVPAGPKPAFRVIWETLDAPYVSREGDANRDGRVDLTDFGILKANFGKHVDRWMVADFDGDGIVGGTDFSTLQNHFGNKSNAAVPAPSSAHLGIIGLFILYALRSIRLVQKPT